MNVLPVTGYSCRYPVYNKQRTTNLNFKGGKPNPEVPIAFAKDMHEFMNEAGPLEKKLREMGKRLSYQIIPTENLAGFVGESASNHDLTGKLGVRFFATDKVDKSETIRLLMMPKEIFGIK